MTTDNPSPNASSMMHRIYLDPPKYGWTAIGGIASILEPHEMARRPDARDAFLSAKKTEGDAPAEEYYTLMKEDKTEPRTSPSKEISPLGKEDEVEGREEIRNELPREEEGPVQQRLLIPKTKDGILDIYTYHRGRVGNEPRTSTGELLCDTDPIDTNHGWIPSDKFIAKVVVDFPLDDEDDAKDDSRIRFCDTIPWSIIDPSTPTPEEFAASLASQFGLSFRQTMELTSSIQIQLDEHVRTKIKRYYPPIIIRDVYGNERPDRQFANSEEVDCFRPAAASLSGEGKVRNVRAVIQRNQGSSSKKGKVARPRPMGQVKTNRGIIELVSKNKVPKANEHGDVYAAEVLQRARTESQLIFSECKARGDTVLWLSPNEVCHICHNRKPAVLTFHCGSHAYCDFHCASRLSFRVHDYDPNDPNKTPIDHCPICTLECTCSKCSRRLEAAASKLKAECLEQNCEPNQVNIPCILKYCCALLTCTPQQQVRRKITPSGGIVKKDPVKVPSKGDSAKRARPRHDDSVSIPTKSPFGENENEDARPSKKRKVERILQTKVQRVLKVRPDEFPKEMYDGVDMDPSEPGDYERTFTTSGFYHAHDSPAAMTSIAGEQKFQDIIPIPLLLQKNFTPCHVCSEVRGELTNCPKCPRSFHSECLARDLGDDDIDEIHTQCHRCKCDVQVLPGEEIPDNCYNNKIMEVYGKNPESTSYVKILECIAAIVKKLSEYHFGNIFSAPVEINEVPGYFDVIKKPMDYGTIITKLESGRYLEPISRVDFKEDPKMVELEKVILLALTDVEQVHQNCMVFNTVGSSFYRAGLVHSQKWKAYLQKVLQNLLSETVVKHLEEFRLKCKLVLDAQHQVRIITGGGPSHSRNARPVAVFDIDTMRIIKQYSSKSSASRAVNHLKEAGYACEYDLNEVNAKHYVIKSSEDPSTLLFGYRWIFTENLRDGNFSVDKNEASPDPNVGLNQTSSAYFQDDYLKSPTAGNILVLKEDTATGFEIRGFESVEAAYQDWSESYSTAINLDPMMDNSITSFKQHFLYGQKNLNGVVWKMISKASEPKDESYFLSTKKNILDQEYAVPVQGGGEVSPEETDILNQHTT